MKEWVKLRVTKRTVVEVAAAAAVVAAVEVLQDQNLDHLQDQVAPPISRKEGKLDIMVPLNTTNMTHQ